jgi:hypothetical protein
MRTTIDLPDPLFRQVKARAALEGRKLKDLLAEYVEQGLRRPQSGPVEAPARRRSDPPILIPRSGNPLPLLTNAELEDLLQMEERGPCPTSRM